MTEASDGGRLRRALARAEESLHLQGGIGTLGEKTLHAAVKYYIEPDPSCHEVPYLGFVADILNADGVTEIQTRSFERLRRKLEVFLDEGPVTLACPLPHLKYVQWLDPATGEVSGRRKSPKTGRPWHILPELDRIREQLEHPNLKLRLMLFDMDEYRNLDGWSRDRKKGSSRRERIPLALYRELWLEKKADWQALIPPELPNEFTRQELARAARFSQRQSAAAIRVLSGLGLCSQHGKRGRAYLYRRESPA